MKLLVALIVGMILGSYAIGLAQIGGGAVGGSGITITNVPGGSNTQVQFNDSNSFGGDSKLVFVKATGVLTATTFIPTTSYKAVDGSAGVTVTTCTAFKNGLCTAGT